MTTIGTKIHHRVPRQLVGNLLTLTRLRARLARRALPLVGAGFVVDREILAGAQTPHLPPSCEQRLQYRQFLQARQSASP